MERQKASRSISKRLYPLENRLVEHPVQAIPHQALVILCICSGFLLPWEVLCCDEYSPLEAPQRNIHHRSSLARFVTWAETVLPRLFMYTLLDAAWLSISSRACLFIWSLKKFCIANVASSSSIQFVVAYLLPRPQASHLNSSA